MKLVFVGPFSRFAYAVQGDAVYVFDGESATPRVPVHTCTTVNDALVWIDAKIAADPTMLPLED